MKHSSLISLSIVTLLAVVGAHSLAQDRDPPEPSAQWEYLQMKAGSDQPTSKLGSQILKLGREGWELVGVENFHKDGTTTATAFYFKRRL